MIWVLAIQDTKNGLPTEVEISLKVMSGQDFAYAGRTDERTTRAIT